jgi:diguanylate cyclase (GGDEF)-like protein/putative nucleotidyltransferase with HDIG domain
VVPLQTSGTSNAADFAHGFATTASLQVGSRPARILIVGGDDHSVTNLQRRLETLGAEVHAHSNSHEVVGAARASDPDLILLEMAVPSSDGLKGIRALKRDPTTYGMPIIVLGSTSDVDDHVQSLAEGASDYVRRPFVPQELIARIQVVLRARTREDLLRRRVGFLEELAASDPLTSLFNRRAFIDRLHLEMERAVRNDQSLSCLVLDIDWFKSINDRYGHQVGDDVLRQIAKILVESRREGDAVCRYGGEEFVWLLPGVGREALVERAEWVRRAIEEAEIPTAEGSFHLSVSIGASTYQLKEHGRISAHVLLEQADLALLDAKKQGKNRVAFREPIAPESQGDTLSGGGERRGGEGSWPDLASPGDEMQRPTGLAGPARTGDREAAAEEQLNTLLLSSVKVLTAALEAKDSETMTHCHRVASTAVAIAMELNLPEREINRIKLASLLHDLGKLAIPETVLRKPTALTPDEWILIKKHPEQGAAMLQEAKFFSHLADLILYHQESYDGTGYPDGLAGREIPLGARIIRAADTFDALTSDRPYRPRKTLEEAKMELRRMAGATLDPTVVETLLRLLATMSPLEMELTMKRDAGLLTEPSAPDDDAGKASDEPRDGY